MDPRRPEGVRDHEAGTDVVAVATSGQRPDIRLVVASTADGFDMEVQSVWWTLVSPQLTQWEGEWKWFGTKQCWSNYPDTSALEQEMSTLFQGVFDHQQLLRECKAKGVTSESIKTLPRPASLFSEATGASLHGGFNMWMSGGQWTFLQDTVMNKKLPNASEMFSLLQRLPKSLNVLKERHRPDQSEASAVSAFRPIEYVYYGSGSSSVSGSSST